MLSILNITDGTTKINLLDTSRGFHLIDWIPTFPQAKNGGVFRSSPLVSGRALVNRQFDNLFETFTVSLDAVSQDDLIRDWNSLIDLLESAVDYWTSAANRTPIYLEAKGPCETNTRYAVIKFYALPTLANPYQPPFNSENGYYVTPDIPITLELGLWTAYPPGQSTCLYMSNTGQSNIYGANLVLNPGFETAGGGGADVFANWTESAGDGAIARDLVTFHSGVAACRLTSGPNSNTHVYQDFAVTAGQDFVYSFWTRGDAVNAGRYRLTNQTSGVDLKSLTSTGVTGATWTIVRFKAVVPVGCATIRVYFYCPVVDTAIGYFDDASGRIESAAVTFGHERTCAADALHLGNIASRVQLTDIYYYDASGSAFSANLINAARPTALLPAIPAASDYLVIGVDASSPYPGPFSSVIFDISTPLLLAQVSTTWEYWNGTTWAAIPAGTRLDDTVLLSSTGIKGLYFDLPYDMDEGTVNGINGFWIRLRVTSVGANPTPPYQDNRPIYTAIYPYMDVLAADVPGTMAAIARMLVEKKSKDITGAEIESFIMASRVLARGSDFNPWLLPSDTDQPLDSTLSPLVTVTVGANTVIRQDYAALADNPAYPNGRIAEYNPGAATAAMASRVKWTILPPLTKSYYGTFRVFLYYYAWDTAALNPDEFTVRLYYGYSLRQTVDVSLDASVNGPPQVVELGMIDLFSDADYSSEQINRIELDLHVSHDSATDNDLYILSLVLMPVDERAAQVTYQNATLDNSNYIDLDGLTKPKLTAEAKLRYGLSGASLDNILDYWSLVAPDGIIVNQKEDTRIWILHLAQSEVVSSPNGYINPRYHIMRGDA